MIKVVEYRFDAILMLPHKIEWFNYNAKCYIAKETIKFAEQMGFTPCTTASYSPEGNGMAEAFVKSSKTDNVYTHD
jgi:putative transposase